MKSKYIQVLLIISIFWIFPLAVTSQNNNTDELVGRIFGKEGEKYFRFNATKEMAISLDRYISVDKVSGEMVYAYANKAGFARFLQTGLAYEILPHPGDVGGAVNMKESVDTRAITDWDFYPTYEAYVDMMYQFAAEYPGLCQVTSIGTSYQGRELLVARISDNVGLNEAEPRFFYTSSIHGDELTGYVLTLRLIDYLLTNYGTDPKVTDMVNGIDIRINPLANPDGTYAGGNNTVDGARRYNALWVDLNRNYPDPDDGPHPDGNDWQTETIHFMNYAEANHIVIGANFHGGAEVCNYPWDTWEHLAADDSWWQYVCREYADTVHEYGPAGYLTDLDNGITNGYAWYTISGGRQDYMNYFHQAREFTLEISETKLPPASQLPLFWNYNYRSLLNYIEQAAFGVRGTVKDASTGWPVQAEVYAILHEEDSSWVYSSLPNGNYHRLLDEGTYTIRYSAPGYETEIRNNVVVQRRQATVLDILLTPSTGVGGLGNNLVSQNTDLYPNPLSGDIATIKSPYDILKITIYDMTGKTVLTREFDNGKYKVNLESLVSGMYFVEFETDQGVGVKKLVIRD